MRALALAAVLAGCFDPTPHEGYACDQGWCPDPLVCMNGICGRSTGSGGSGPWNVVFVTSMPTPMPIGMYSAPEELDALCQASAMAAPIPENTYVAWISTLLGPSAVDRLGSARGFVRPDGSPFADTVPDIIQGKLYNPIELDPYSKLVPYTADVVTQTADDGTFSTNDAAGDCITDPTATKSTSGQAMATFSNWTAHATVDCTETAYVYCFGTRYTTPLPPPVSAPGKLVFLSSISVPVTAGGTNAFDAECNKEAVAGGLTQTFRAMVATSTMPGGRGAVSADGWHRPDQVTAITSTFDVVSPINVRLDGSYNDDHTWTGASFTSTETSNTCADWTTPNSAVTGRLGNGTRTGVDAYDDSDSACNDSHHLYCIEP